MLSVFCFHCFTLLSLICAEICRIFVCIKYMAFYVVRTNVIYVRKIRTNSWIKSLFFKLLIFVNKIKF